jgi:hypothetical protein
LRDLLFFPLQKDFFPFLSVFLHFLSYLEKPPHSNIIIIIFSCLILILK